MLDVLRRSQRWLMWFVIIGVGFVFAVYLGFGGGAAGTTAGVVAEVDGVRFVPRDIDRVRRNQEAQYRSTLGDDFDPSAIADQLDELATNMLVNQAILARDAKRLGLVVSESELRDYVRQIPGAVDENGRLRSEDLRFYAESEYGTETKFAETIRMDLLALKLRRLFDESLDVSEQEALESLLYRREEIQIAYVALDTTTLPAGVEISEAEIETLLVAEEADLRQRYEENRGKYDRPEQVRARHVLLRIPTEATEEERAGIREQAEAALARIQGGADFAEVAAELSEDPGSKEEGGDLGFFGRGQMVKPFEDVAFTLEPGQVSDLVESSFGLHIIRVEEKRAPETIPFEVAGRELAEEILRERRAETQARETAQQLSDAIREGETLVDAARAEEVVLERPDPLRRRPDGYVPGLGAAPELLGTAFNLSEASPTSARIFEIGNQLVLVQLIERTTPTEEELSIEVAAERERLQAAQRDLLPGIWLIERRTALTDAGKISVDLSLIQ